MTRTKSKNKDVPIKYPNKHLNSRICYEVLLASVPASSHFDINLETIPDSEVNHSTDGQTFNALLMNLTLIMEGIYYILLMCDELFFRDDFLF